jgi:hypothetical protein
MISDLTAQEHAVNDVQRQNQTEGRDQTHGAIVGPVCVPSS